ncbi:MAG TPA: PPOX class F420-dependent oxidoreductase [Terriglobales bacterium]|nr:PPOX class F420-dependent oxidoreductase [Terriglobales bacterium]
MIGPLQSAQLQGQKYISLATFRRNGQEVRTPVWFAEQAGKLYVMTRSDSGKYKRIRNNPQVRLAPCTARGKVIGGWSDGQARILNPEEEGIARQALAGKYFLMRFPWLWSWKNIFLEITLA